MTGNLIYIGYLIKKIITQHLLQFRIISIKIILIRFKIKGDLLLIKLQNVNNKLKLISL